MTLRATILWMLVGSGVFAMAIGAYVGARVAPDARAREAELLAFQGELEQLGASRDALDASLRRAHAMPTTGRPTSETLSGVRNPLPGTAAMRSAIALERIGPDMRLALGSAAASESRLQNLLLEFVSHLELGDGDAAETKLARADSTRAALDGHLSRVTGFAVSDLLERQRGVSISARRLRSTAILWMVFAVAAIPGAWLVLHRRLYRPLSALDEGLEHIAKGSFPAPLPVSRRDEMGRLADQFNRVAGILQEESERTRDEIVRWEHIFDHAAFGVTIAEPETRKLLRVNTAYARILGRTPDEVVELNLKDLCPPRLHAELDAHFERLEAEGSDVYETVRLDKLGREVSVQVDASKIERGGRLVCYACVVQDITERKEAENEREAMITELEGQNEELERFSYTVSHDLRAPLVTIRGFLGLVRRDAEAGDQKRLEGDLAHIKEAADKMGELLDDILELSRIGRLVNVPETVSVTDLATEAGDLVRGALNLAGAELTVLEGLPEVYGDRTRLLEVFQNLIDNAAKFSAEEEAPLVEVGAETNGDLVRCYVRDNGPGVSPEYHHRIFGLFDRLNPDSEGTGIGLAIVKRIVEHHGGRVWVESEGTGDGTVFWFDLPREGAHGTGE